MRQDQEREMLAQIAAGTKLQEDLERLPLPKIPYVSPCGVAEEILLLIIGHSSTVPVSSNYDSNRLPRG